MAERGGCRQKRARYEAESAEAATEGSQLAFFLVSQTMWGAMSTKLCKTIAEHARRDIEYANLQHNGFIFKDLNALAYVSSNHSYEHLRQKISPPRMHVDNISLPLKVAGRKFWGDQSVVWPHQCIHDLYHNYPNEFTKRVLPDFSAIKKFWESMDGSPFLHNHPMVARRGWEDTVVPLSIHGDGVTVTGVGRSWNKSVDVLSWASLLASGATLSIFHLIFIIFDTLYCEIDGEHSFIVFYVNLNGASKLAWRANFHLLTKTGSHTPAGAAAFA